MYSALITMGRDTPICYNYDKQNDKVSKEDIYEKSSIIDTPDARHANTFIMKATLDGSTSNMLVITAPIIWYSGAPGGCPTSSFTAVEVYSGQSHNGVVGSVVMMYTVDATANISHPRTVFMFLNVGFICMVCNFFSFP